MKEVAQYVEFPVLGSLTLRKKTVSAREFTTSTFVTLKYGTDEVATEVVARAVQRAASKSIERILRVDKCE